MTGDELDAVARRLGAARFPGVSSSVFDEVCASHHGLLTERLLAALTARGLVGERDDRIVATPEVAALLAPTLRGTLRYEISRVSPDSVVVTALGECEGLVVWHRADGPYHRFDPVGTDGDVARALVALVDPASGAVSGRPFRCRRSRLPDRLGVSAASAWRVTTTMSQAGEDALSWLSIIDCGPGQVWLVEPDPDSPDDGFLDGDDPVLRVVPVDAESLHGELSRWCGTAAGVSRS